MGKNGLLHWKLGLEVPTILLGCHYLFMFRNNFFKMKVRQFSALLEFLSVFLILFMPNDTRH